VRKLCERAGGVPGVRKLLDLPSVTAQAKGLPDGVVKVGRNLVDPFSEVVKGAKAFYFRMLLHDWPEMWALTILANIVNTMADDIVREVNIADAETEIMHFDAKIDWKIRRRSMRWKEEGTKGKKALMECGSKR
jgi:hypothetical protein